MFDTVGRHNDEEATRRSFASLLITGLLLGAGAAFTVGFTTYQVVEQLTDTETVCEWDPTLVEVDEVIPDLPPLPPAPAKARKGVADAPEDPPEADEPVADPAPLEAAKTKMVDSSPVKGLADGGDDGDPDSKNLGPGNGTCVENCAPGGTGEADLRFFHSTELDVKRRARVIYPDAAAQAGLGEQRCVAQVRMSEKGVPYSVEVRGCPKIFHEATRSALMKWRWYPPKRNKIRTKASVSIAVVFKE